MPRRSLLIASLVSLASMAYACAALAQSCITGPALSTGPAELCAPAGYGAYYWAPPGGGVQFTQCITATESGIYSVRFGADANSLGEPCLFKFEILPPPTCDITGPESVCRGDKAELCGPEGDLTYAWSGPNGFIADTRCITVSDEGIYDLLVTDNQTQGTCKNSFALKLTDCVTSCPRTIGFWGQQALQKNDGSAKFTKAEVTSIAGCIDDKAAIFNWSDDFAGFAATINPTIANQRTQALRQFAGFLANVCTDELNLIASNGDEILLDPTVGATCGGSTTTIGALIGSIDAKLVALAGQSLSSGSVKSQYSAIITCLDDINNGRTIGRVCPALLAASLYTGRADRPAEELGAQEIQLYRAYPNPSGVSENVRIAYAIPAGGAQVRIGVYDIAGRLVQTLANGFQPAGRYETSWDGSSVSGSRARAGIYFVRGSAGSQQFQSRILRLN